MDPAAIGIAARQADVQGFGSKAVVEIRLLERMPTCRNGVRQSALQLIDRRAPPLALIFREAAQGLQGGGDHSALAQRANPQDFELIQ